MQRLDLKRIRRERKLTQVKLSEMTGYPQGFISQMENGNEAIPKSFITILADKLQIANIDQYFVDDDKDAEARKVLNSCIGRNARWQNGSSDSTIQRLLTMVERKEEKIDDLEAEMREMRAKIRELEAQIRNLAK